MCLNVSSHNDTYSMGGTLRFSPLFFFFCLTIPELKTLNVNSLFWLVGSGLISLYVNCCKQTNCGNCTFYTLTTLYVVHSRVEHLIRVQIHNCVSQGIAPKISSLSLFNSKSRIFETHVLFFFFLHCSQKLYTWWDSLEIK